MAEQEDRPVLYTMRVKTPRWEALKRAHDIVFGEAIYINADAGLISAKIYLNRADPEEVMFVSEWRSEADLRMFSLEHGERFNELAGTGAGEGEDIVWGLVDAMILESPIEEL